ncbi:DUF1080 domain-containing protein [Mucilaginibacter sp. X4EP1]|uniref:DUF1080 domain-containing protein n=1 Tax=Mucilaginibacter sp. X4EP1 TaxID=2723092 RepID=UPI002168E05A|nr:DUF1080 domain-containing protein [Mucilaginibacter sp. X4EP1]MCS3813192.1 hypothetical protein [Mucilaginibacter sp. X4EP1]
MERKILGTILLLMIVYAQALKAQNQSVTHNYSVIKPNDWSIPRNDTVDYTFNEYLGQKALLMKRKYGNYKAGTPIYPKDLNFKDGIIEMDIAWPGAKGGYIGFAFRIKDPHHYETVYFRPESSGTINAIQYMPEKKADFNWWDYESDKYQAKATLPMHSWFHVKAIVKGSTVSVFVNNEAKPSLVYNHLDGSLKSGSVGYWFGNSSDGAYRNLTVKKF